MLTPYPYQTEAIEMGVESNLLCADACGLGKTLVGIEIARHIQKDNPHPILVVSTNGARLQWVYAIQEQLSNAQSNAPINVLNAVVDYEYMYEGSHTNSWYVIHYAALRKMTHRDMLARTFFSTIILDEVHRIKNRNARQTKGVKKITSHRKVGLTATEMERSPEDLWSLLNWLDRDRFRGFHGFAAKYVEYEVHPYFGWKKAVGPKNLDRLVTNLDGMYIKRSKEDVKSDLPPLTESRVPLSLNGKLLDAYTEIESAGDILVTLDEMELVIPNVLASIMKRRQLTSNGLGRYTSAKVDWVTNYMADNPNENVLIFSVFRDTARLLADKLDVPLVMGGEEPPDIQRLKPRVLVGTIKALGESHDLPWMDTAIFIDCEWSTILMTQARDRFHRINITSPKHAIYLYHPGTVDELVFEALDNKWSMTQAVTEYIRRHVAQGG
jgi:superfamily II DNA or RNA helicase